MTDSQNHLDLNTLSNMLHMLSPSFEKSQHMAKSMQNYSACRVMLNVQVGKYVKHTLPGAELGGGQEETLTVACEQQRHRPACATGQRSLISAFDICYLKSKVTSLGKISFYSPWMGFNMIKRLATPLLTTSFFKKLFTLHVW